MSAPAADWVWLARIRRPQGRKGEVFAEILTDFPEKFEQRRQLWLLPDSGGSPSRPGTAAPASEAASGMPGSTTDASDGSRPAELVHHWLHKGGVVLHFAGVQSISDAEKLAGLVVAIPREQRAHLAEDEIYIGDLIGCQLIDVAGGDDPQAIGEIENVDRDAGPVPLLIVRGPHGEVLIPLAKKYLREIDLDRKRVEMALPEGLIDLNA